MTPFKSSIPILFVEAQSFLKKRPSRKFLDGFLEIAEIAE